MAGGAAWGDLHQQIADIVVPLSTNIYFTAHPPRHPSRVASSTVKLCMVPSTGAALLDYCWVIFVKLAVNL